MALHWSTQIRTRAGREPVDILWATDFPHIYEIYTPAGAISVLYIDGREHGSGNDAGLLVAAAQLHHDDFHRAVERIWFPYSEAVGRRH